MNRPQEILQGRFSARIELFGGNFTDGYFTRENISTEEFSVRGGYFMEGEPDLPVSFEKRSKIK